MALPEIHWSRVLPGVAFLICVAAGVALKLYYSGAPDDEPRWLLAATARLFSFASGVPFHFAEGRGYLSADGRLLLYRGCSGLNFLVLTGFLAALLPIASRMPFENPKAAAPATFASLFFYYCAALPAVVLFTLLANVGRMLTLLTLAPAAPWILHPGAGHLGVGTFVYLVFLILFYLSLRLTLRKIEREI